MDVLLGWVTLAILMVTSTEGTRVLELSDRFLQLKDEHDGPWLIKFYAPWCHHCKNLEPIWSQVAQSLYDTNINVGRVDCTRFTSVATHFEVSGFPTILYIEKDFVLTYHGDRTREDMVDFARKMLGPPVREIPNAEKMETIRRSNKLFFLFITPEVNSELKLAYQMVAVKFRHLINFFQVKDSIADEALGADMPSAPAILVYKDSNYQPYLPDAESENMTESLIEWVNKERFSLVSKISNGNFNEIIQTRKFLVIALLEEIMDGKLKQEHANYMNKFESHCAKNKDKYKKDFVFGWIGNPDLTSSITMMFLPLPNIMVLNATTYHYHLLSDTGVDPHYFTSEQLDNFLEMVVKESLPTYGGTGLGSRIYRVYFDITTTFQMMWSGSPILTLLLFGVPLGFLSLICYTTFCSEIMDSNEEDEDMDNAHQKKE